MNVTIDDSGTHKTWLAETEHTRVKMEIIPPRYSPYEREAVTIVKTTRVGAKGITRNKRAFRDYTNAVEYAERHWLKLIQWLSEEQDQCS